jgi:hypothetical protein
MPIPLEICTRPVAGLFKSGKEFHEVIRRDALICCQKYDERV